MAKKSTARDLADEEVLRVARIRVTESAAATFTQSEVDTQLSVERGVIWMIHYIEFLYGNLDLLAEVGANAVERVIVQVTREGKTAIVAGNDSDIIQIASRSLFRSAAIGTDAGPLYAHINELDRFDYPTPIPYASQSIFVGALGTDSANTHTVDCRIGYTIREVSDKFFFRVAQALLG
jgi:hypothetical protein